MIGAEQRAAALLELIQRLGAGDTVARGTPSGSGDVLDAAIEGLNVLAAQLAELKGMRVKWDERMSEFYEVLAAVLASDYSRRASLNGEHDTSDAVAAALNLVSEELEASAGLAHTALFGMADAVISVDLEGLVTNANESAGSLLDRPSSELVNLPLPALFDSSISALESQERLAMLPARDELAHGLPKGGRRIPVSLSASLLRDARGDPFGVVYVARDITERKRAEDQARERLESALRLQAATILELSTPLFPVSEGVVVMPLIGAVGPERALQIMDALLHGIERFSARVAILDITGVHVVDAEVAAVLLRAVRAAALVGARVVLTGIRPDVARTLVALEIDLTGVVTAGTLQSGIELALGTRRRRG